VVDIAKLDEGTMAPSSKLDRTLIERWPSLWRVVLAADAAQTPPVRLGDFTPMAGHGLRIRYELNTEPDHPVTEADEPDAIYIPAERVLYVRDIQPLPERALARELAVAICGPRNAPRAAIGFLEVLRSASPAEAEDALDDLGIARAVDDIPDYIEEEAGAVLGGLSDTGEGPAIETPGECGEGSPDDAPSDKAVTSGLGPGSRAPGAPANGHGSGRDNEHPGSAGRASAGHSARSGTVGTTPSDTRANARRSSSSGTAEAVLRSYLPAPRDGDLEVNPEAAARRKATDEAGVRRALKYERESGRDPQEMPHGNPGFDITSRLHGAVVRYIEVKSLSGPWRDASPSLSRPQHDRAMQEGDLYWLYVVENVGQPTEAIHTIQDPIGQATHFGFDPGWMDVAWDAEAPSEILEAVGEESTVEG
jgi:hypothetical protein